MCEAFSCFSRNGKGNGNRRIKDEKPIKYKEKQLRPKPNKCTELSKPEMGNSRSKRKI